MADVMIVTVPFGHGFPSEATRGSIPTVAVDSQYFGTTTAFIFLLFERSEFLIDTSQKKSLHACTRARVHACSTSLGFSVGSANRIWPKHGIPLPV